MKIIDLLNKIANGKKYSKKARIRYFDKQNDYKDECILTIYAIGYRLHNAIFGLNDEVEIIEEEKKIPEKICTNRIINTKDILEFEMIQNKINAEYTYAINEIIDYLKSKGDE